MNRLWIFLVTLTLSISAVGQVQTGTLSGTVRDQAGAAVSNSKVSIKSIETGAERSVTANSQGTFIIPGLAPGNYEVLVSAQGFAQLKQQSQITVGGQTSIDAVLSVSSANTTVEVREESASVEVNTQTQEQSQIVTSEQINDLPSLTRNPYDFVALAGNVSGGDRSSESGNVQTSGGGQNSTDRGVGFAINGQRASGTEILLDGVENTNLFDTSIALLIPQDAVQEFRILTNNFDAQYGRASGGVINVSSKSGSNDFHGRLWEFNRLSAYTANTYDNDANDIPKGKYTRNQFGFVVGGPVVKNKLFFFGSTEWLRVRSNSSLLAYVPTPQFLAAMAPNVQDYFTQFGGPVTYRTTVSKADLAGQGFFTPGGAFDTAVPDPATPVFGLANYTAPFDAGGDSPQNTYTSTARADYNLSDRTQMFFRYGREKLDLLPGSSFNSPYTQYNVGFGLTDDSYLLSATHNFTQNLLSNTRLTFSRDVTLDTYDASLGNTPTLFLFNGATLNGQPISLPGFFDGSTGVGGLPYGGPQNTIQAFEDIAWTHGTHTLRYGGQYDYIQLNKSYGAYAQAVEQLGVDPQSGMDAIVQGTLTNFVGAVNPQGKVPCQRDFITQALVQTPGCTVTLPATEPAFARSYRYKDWAVYAQDSWRATRRLTLNYGMRYEYYGVQHNANPELDSNIYYGPGSNVFQQLRNASIYTAPQSPVGGLWNPNYGTVAPRLGFAYDVFGDGSTSVRGGFGMSYERNFGNVTFNMIQNPPNYATVQVHGVPVTTSDFGPLGGGTGSVALPPVSPRQVDQNIDTAQTQFWGMSLERSIGRRSILAIDYNGAHGVHLYDIKNINELGGGQVYLGDPLVSNAACGGPCYSRPNAQFTSINNRGSQGFSHYNGLNIRYQTQDLGNTGLSVVSNYTWSHALDNLSSTFSESSSTSNGVGNLGYLDPRNPALDYGNADFDIRHRYVLSVIWTDPFFKSGHGWKQQSLGGWLLTPMYSVRSGVPFTVVDSTNSLNANFGPYGIPRYTPSAPYSTTTGSAVATGPNNFNLLTLPSADSWTGTLGVSDFGPYPAAMTGRNVFRGPGAWNFDMALSKTFKLTERVGLELRAEGFDLLNHHNLYVNGFVANAAFFTAGQPFEIEGKKGGLGAAANNGNHDERRFGQFALRLSF